MKIKILNLYCGIGGNRKLWNGDIEVTAIENNPYIAKIYQHFFPNDKVIVADAHQFLLEHYKEFDFIWSSPPCPTHSRMRKINVGVGERKKPLNYPDMNLYQEIIILQHFFKGKFVVENVISYYKPLIQPIRLGRHYLWSNFAIPTIQINNTMNIKNGIRDIGFDLKGLKTNYRKDVIMRNCVEPELGLHVFKSAFKIK